MLKNFFNVVMEVTYLTSRPNKNKQNSDRVIEDYQHLKTYIRDLNRSWEYEYDKWYGLLNHINVPPQAVLTNVGDCDDYASHVYHIGRRFDAFLLTYFPKKLSNAHTVTVFNLGEKFVLVNWGRITSHTSILDVKTNLEKYSDSKMISMHWAKYDYDKKRFISVKEPKLREGKITQN